MPPNPPNKRFSKNILNPPPRNEILETPLNIAMNNNFKAALLDDWRENTNTNNFILDI